MDTSLEVVTLPVDFRETLPQTVAEKQASYRAMKDQELIEYMRGRGLRPAYNEDGKMIRKESFTLLREMDERLATEEKRKRRVRVVFHKSANVSAGDYVFASVNDRNFQAPYDREVIIPEYMLTECIDRAYTTVAVPQNILDPMSGKYKTIRKAERFQLYPYTKLGYGD